jgi:lipopolysaccharide transport system ATP-binding protein
MKPILEVRNISKRYRLLHSEGYLSLRERMLKAFAFRSGTLEDFWALNDVSFDVNPGDSIGIVGKNGAGKSTLLKILSRITPPTKGKIVTRGRIASLLEVGTGFHPELTGRENIFFNGSLLGMKRREIESKFDEIVSFSGTEKFLDTPLKHYSSGMQLRLAFAVAAHLEPEILIIDEVLAVGDAEFQKKCLGKMEDVTKQGRTILFVSHNMGAVKTLCKKGILLEKGGVKSIGEAREIAELYIAGGSVTNGIFYFQKPKMVTQGYANSLTILNEKNEQVEAVSVFKPFSLQLEFTIEEETKHFIIGMGLTTLDDTPVRTVWSTPVDISPGVYKAVFKEKNIFFASGKYKIIVGLSSREQPFQYLPDAGIIEFEKATDKDKILHTALGLILNPMEIHIEKH